MDRFIRSLFFMSGLRQELRESEHSALTVLALGSFGRRELCFYSDVDLMLIHQGKLSPQMNQAIARALYPLWDAKLEVGYSVLTIPECIRLAANDFQVLTSLLDARFLFGSRGLYRLFEAAYRARIDRKKESLLEQFLISRKKREERYGNEDFFVEPDVKEGLGGLRDLHFMAWMARIYFKCTSLSQIRRFAVFSHFGTAKLGQSKGFLLKVRNLLHLLSGRREDRLLLSRRKDLSELLGYPGNLHIAGSEKFMRHVYLHLNRVRYGHEEFQTKALDLIAPLPIEPTPQQVPLEYRVFKGHLVLREESLWGKEPVMILKTFLEANRLGLFPGSGFIWEARKRIVTQGRQLLETPGAKEMFLSLILDPRNPKVSRLALDVGLVSLFIPEFRRIRNLAQSDYYHVETVDFHSLKAVEVIGDIAGGKYEDRRPLFKEVFGELEHPDWLYLAGLLHDIGKGYAGDHAQKGAELVPRMLKRLGISGKALSVIPFLVRHHLLLARTSQRRDLGEERTSVRVAQIVQDNDILRMLFLLTVADSLSTGPMARSEWRIMLLIELFFKVRRVLERGTLASPSATKRLEIQKSALFEKLEPDFSRKNIERLMDQVSPRYFLNVSVEDMVHHFRLALTLGDDDFAWTLVKLKDAPVTRAILCTYDWRGLFSRMVGVFTLHNINVLSANIFTLKNGLAFDIYEVTNPLDPYREAEQWEKVCNDIRLALKDRIPLDELITRKGRATASSNKYRIPQKRKVKIDNEVSDFFTVIEVGSAGRLELLYELSKAFLSLRLDIRFAKVTSDHEKMTGVFYVRQADGQKVQERTESNRIEETILSVIG